MTEEASEAHCSLRAERLQAQSAQSQSSPRSHRPRTGPPDSAGSVSRHRFPVAVQERQAVACSESPVSVAPLRLSASERERSPDQVHPPVQQQALQVSGSAPPAASPCTSRLSSVGPRVCPPVQSEEMPDLPRCADARYRSVGQGCWTRLS